MNKQNFIEKTTILSEVFNKDYNKLTLDMYYKILSEELSDNEFNAAVMDILKNRKYTNFPTPAEFLEYAKGSKQDNMKSKLIDAEEKFKIILHSGRSVKCDDWAIHSTIKKMGGLDAIRKGKIDNEVWLIKEFLEKYEIEIQRKNVGTEIPVILYTEKDKQQIKMGISTLPVKQIGDVEKWNVWQLALKNRKAKEIKLLGGKSND